MFYITCNLAGCINQGITFIFPEIGDIAVCGPCGTQLEIKTAEVSD